VNENDAELIAAHQAAQVERDKVSAKIHSLSRMGRPVPPSLRVHESALRDVEDAYHRAAVDAYARRWASRSEPFTDGGWGAAVEAHMDDLSW
jgi:hypothetical protein